MLCEDSNGCPSPTDETIPERVGEAAETREGLVDLRSAEQVKCPWARTGGGTKRLKRAILLGAGVLQPAQVINFFIFGDYYVC